MKILQCVVAAGVLIVGVNQVNSFHAASASLSEAGFVAVAAPDEANPGEVLVIGPDCDEPDGIRTRALASELAKAQIPHRLTTAFSVTDPGDWQGLMRLQELMEGDRPFVIINGRAKANPTLSDVIAEYNQVATQ